MNTFNYIHKQAAAATTVTAGAVIASKALDLLKSLGGTAAKGAGKIIDFGFNKAPGLALGTAAVLGLGTGYGLARLKDPTVVSENSDKILESEALATEIAVTERKLKALEARRKERQAKKRAEQPYDRFV